MGAYVRFCSSQYTAAGLLQKLVEIKPGFDEFLRQCQSGPKIKGMPLSFFLLKVGKSQKQLFLSSILPKNEWKVELVSKELNHLAAILHVYAERFNFMK